MKTKPIDCSLEKIAPEAIGAAAEMLKILAHPVRLQIIDLLNAAGEISVGEISARYELAQATTSQHLNHMRRVGLVKAERRGKEMWYSIADPRPISLLNCICHCCEK